MCTFLLRNGAILDICEMHCGICEMAKLTIWIYRRQYRHVTLLIYISAHGICTVLTAFVVLIMYPHQSIFTSCSILTSVCLQSLRVVPIILSHNAVELYCVSEKNTSVATTSHGSTARSVGFRWGQNPDVFTGEPYRRLVPYLCEIMCIKTILLKTSWDILELICTIYA